VANRRPSDDGPLDALFLHAGMRRYYHVFPMGVFGMIDRLRAAGRRARIVNVGVEQALDPQFSLARCLERYRPRVVCLDLHWYVHSFSQIELARQVRALTAAPIVLGGYTASFFAAELVRDHPFIDGVIRGEGDVTLPAFVAASESGEWEEVPGLTWRRDGEIVENPAAVPANDELDAIRYADLEALDNWPAYVSTSSAAGPVIFLYPPKTPARVFYLPIGRGCSVNCSYCTAARASTGPLMNRAKRYYRPIDAVVDDFVRLAGQGIETVVLEYYPAPPNDDYYEELFARLREKRLNIGVNFGAWSLPTPRLVDAFARTFNPDWSCLSFSPESGSEKVRELNKGQSYGNAQVYELAARLAERQVYFSVHFGLGFPGEDWPEFAQTLKMQRRLRGPGRYLSIRAIPLEPGSPMFVNPEKFGVRRFWTCFADYYNHFRELSENRVPTHAFGYETNLLPEAELHRMKIKAYRAFYWNWRFIRQRLPYLRLTGGSGSYFAWGLAALIGSARLLSKHER
jgi:radical SAM superfamily enzyme YgiQ (UPF0313 family)